MHAAYNVWCVADRPDRAVKTIRDELLLAKISALCQPPVRSATAGAKLLSGDIFKWVL